MRKGRKKEKKGERREIGLEREGGRGKRDTGRLKDEKGGGRAT